MMKPKCIILLSTKCAGSSAVQHYVAENYGANLINWTPHHENETLFWVKAAAVLGMQQERLHRSSAPHKRAAAKKALSKLLARNKVTGFGAPWTKTSIFKAFAQLVHNNGPVFFEKSPHHLYNMACLQLMHECSDFLRDEIDFYFLGLVRNPMDTVYSAWRRWKFNCRMFEKECSRSYKNLQQFQARMPATKLLRYEDLASNSTALDRYLIESCGLTQRSTHYKLNADSIGRWRNNNAFKHNLSADTVSLAAVWKYQTEELIPENKPDFWWTLHEWTNDCRHYIRKYRRTLNGSHKNA